MRSRRVAAIAIAVTVLVGLLGLAITGAGKRTDLVLETAVNPTYPVGPIGHGATLCQEPLGITDAFERVRLNVGTFGKPGPPLTVRVLDHSSGAELARGEQQAGWIDDGTPRTIDVGPVKPGEQVDVCVSNQGRVPAFAYGDYYRGTFRTGPLGVTPTNSTSAAYLDHTRLEGDVAMSLLSSKKRSALSRIPATIRHAAAFKPGFAGPWLYWLLGAAILVGAPVALWAALVSAGRDSDRQR